MRITVGIPVYNRVKNIAFCIDSALNQNIKNNIDYSILIVDNNSDDGTQNILKQYEKNPKVKVIYNSTNIGMAANWTKVFKLSEAEYTFLLHSDDLLYPDTIEIVFQFLKDYPNCEFGFGKVDLQKGKTKRKNLFSLKNKRTGYIDNNWLLENYFYKANHPCPPQTWFLKKGIIQNLGDFLEDNICCDFNMSFKIVASKHKIGYIDKSLTKWVLHENNTAGGDIRKHKAHLIAAINDLKENNKKFSIDVDKLKESQTWIEKYELLELLKIGENKIANEKAEQLVQYLSINSSIELLILFFCYTRLNLIKPLYKVKILLDTI